MGLARNWTPEEYTYLQDNWGQTSLKTIAAKLNRSPAGIKIKVQRLGLGAFLDSGEYITYNQLLLAVGKSSYGYTITSWVENRGLPIKYKTVDNCRFRVIYIEDFWKWAKKNRGFVDFSKFPENAIGKEPAWVKEQRQISTTAKHSYHATPWTTAEDNQLKMLLNQYKYGYREISQRLQRTDGAIQRRINDLGLKERPLKADTHNPWTNEEYHQLGEMIKRGYCYALLSTKFGRSAKAIQGRVYWMYLTENLDKVRAIIGDGQWGDNRPDRPIKHTTLNTEERKEVQTLAATLAGQLKGILKSHFDECDYWQKDLCQHWGGCCTAGEINCDTCTKFQRIREQYCRRCGGTFFERFENGLCMTCRGARKKQAQRKWAVLNRKGA